MGGTQDVLALRIPLTLNVHQTVTPTLDKTLGVRAARILLIRNVLRIVIITAGMTRAASLTASACPSPRSAHTFVTIILVIRFVKGWNCLDSLEWLKQHQQLQQGGRRLREEGDREKRQKHSLGMTTIIMSIMESTMVIMDTMEIQDITHSTVSTMTLGMAGETATERSDLVRGASTLRRLRRGTGAAAPAW